MSVLDLNLILVQMTDLLRLLVPLLTPIPPLTMMISSKYDILKVSNINNAYKESCQSQLNIV